MLTTPVLIFSNILYPKCKVNQIKLDLYYGIFSSQSLYM